MENEQFKFDNNRRKAESCPCGKSNKDGKFATFKGFDNKGYCHSCDETFFPDKEYKFERYIATPKAPVNLTSEEHFEKSLSKYENNNFTLFLESTFGSDIAFEVIQRYYIGTYGDRPVFWQIDENNNIRTGKIMDYKLETGKRIKTGYKNWVHILVKQESMKTCLFGLHLINNDKPIAIVESEKTAIIMSYINPYYNWLATGGIGNLKIDALIGRDITLYPDHEGYDQWKMKAKKSGLEYKISKDCEIWFEEGKIEQGNDIADYYLINHKFKFDLNWTEVQNR